MKIGIFAKTFSRPTIEGLLETIAGYEIYSAQFNLSCVGLETLPTNVPDALARRVINAAEQAKVELSAMSGTFNMAHPDPAVRRDGLTKFEVLCGLFDPTRLAPQSSFVRIGQGRDAANTSFATIFGGAVMNKIELSMQPSTGLSNYP